MTRVWWCFMFVCNREMCFSVTT